MAENKLSVQMLGQPLITWGEQPLTIPRRQARLLLYYLACHKEMISREDLTLIFWPESANPRQQLRDLLSKLRTELPDPDILVADREWIGLNYDIVYSDVITFEENYDQISLPFFSNEKRPLPEAIYRKILAAVNMWKSPRFMYGVGVLDSEELNEWLEEKNRKLRFKWLTLMMRIAQHLKVIGDLEGALYWLEKIRENDDDYNFPQVIYLHLEALYQLGQLGKAFEFGQKFIDYLETGWFVEYKLPFETLMQRIGKERNQYNNIEQAPSRSENGMSVPLIGRDDALTQILRAFHRGNITIIAGETGMGKTRLMHEFVNRLAVPISILTMEAIYMERDIPFHPIIELLRNSMNMNDWQKVESFWLAQLIPLFPELQNLVEKREDVINVVENKRLSLYESFRQVLLTLVGSNKVLMIIENAQWCDEETVRLFAYLTRRRFFNENAHLILLTNQHQEQTFEIDYRDFPVWVEQIAWIKVPPLNLEDVSNLALYMVRTPISEKQAQQLLDATGGNPLFIIETLQMILEKPDNLGKEEWKDIPLSGVVRLVLRERLQHLSINAKQTLRAAAVVGVEFSFDYVQVMLDFAEFDLVAAINELIEKEFVTVVSQSQHPLEYRFCLTLLRDVVLLEISMTEKQILHRRLATHLLEVMENEAMAQQVADVAFHLGHAGRVKDAFKYWIQAADLYVMTGDLINANHAFKNALQLSQNKNFEITEQELYELWVGWAELAVIENDIQKATGYYQRALQEGLTRNSPILIGSGLSGEGYLYLVRGLPIQASQYLDRAITLLRDGSVLEYIRASIRKMLVNMYHFNLTESEQVFDGILWLEDQLQSPKEFIAYSNARNTIALTKVLMGKFEEAAQLIEKSNQVAHKYNNGVLRMRNEFALGLSYFYQGMNEKALEHMGIAINIAENNYNWRFIIETLSVTSHVHLAKGKSIASFECIQNAYNLAKAYQYTGLHGVLINAEGKIHLAYGNHKQAIHLFEEAMKFSTNERYFLMSQSWKSFAQASLGNFDDPIHRMEQIRAEADKKRWAELWMKSSAHLGVSLYLAGNVKEALDVLEEYGKKAKEMGFGSAGAAFAYVQAKEAIKQSNYDLVRANGKILLETSAREKSLWLQWLALELMLAGESEGELEPANYKIQLKHVVREINQSKPAWINFDHDPNKPSLFGLV